MRYEARLLAAAIALPLSTGGASELMAQSAVSQPASIKKDELDRPICRREKEPGVILRFKKTCKTKLQWEQERALMQTDRETGENRALINSCAGASC